MNKIDIPDKRKVFIGVDCSDDKKIHLALINTYGNLLSSGTAFFPKDDTRLGEFTVNNIKALRGGANVRTKNFAGIGISFADPDMQPINLEHQFSQLTDIPVSIGNYAHVKQAGDEWLKKLGSITGIIDRSVYKDFRAIYGVVKLVKENAYTLNS